MRERERTEAELIISSPRGSNVNDEGSEEDGLGTCSCSSRGINRGINERYNHSYPKEKTKTVSTESNRITARTEYPPSPTSSSPHSNPDCVQP